MSVTRGSLKLADGTVGHAMVQGRDRRKAEIAALADALMQGDQANTVRKGLLEPLQAAAEARATKRAEKAAATKVDFFTMVRGEA